MSPPDTRTDPVGPALEIAHRWTITHQDSRGSAEMVYTRSSNLSDQLDTSATEQLAQMVAEGWEPTTAAQAWRDWVGVVAEAAADAALAEGSWDAS